MGALIDAMGTSLRNSITLESNNKIQFRDTGIFIQSDVDGGIKISTDGTTGNMIKLVLGDASGNANVAVVDLQAFPMLQLDSNGNLKYKGISKRTTTGANQ